MVLKEKKTFPNTILSGGLLEEIFPWQDYVGKESENHTGIFPVEDYVGKGPRTCTVFVGQHCLLDSALDLYRSVGWCVLTEGVAACEAVASLAVVCLAGFCGSAPVCNAPPLVHIIFCCIGCVIQLASSLNS